MFRPSRFILLLCTVPVFGASTEAALPQAQTILSRLPLRFESNQGQTSPSVRFIARAGAYRLLLTNSGPSVTIGSHKIDVSLLHSNPAPRIEGLNPLPTRTDYLVGNRQQWHTGVASYERVRYSAVYPGVDMVYYGNQSQLEYDFVLAPGADPDAIRMRFQGAGSVRLTAEGDLVVANKGSEMVQRRPFIYQQEPGSGARREVQGRYVLLGRNTVGLKLDGYDRTRQLVIDPVLSYLTYMGGRVSDRINAMKYANGKIYIAGQTDNGDMPYIDGAYNNNFTGLTDIFVAIVDATPGNGFPLLYFTYLGGANVDIAQAIDVDAKGAIYLTGTTTSTNFPTTGNAFQASGAGAFTGTFVTKLDPSLYGGDSLVFSSYLGGLAGVNIGNGIAVDKNGLIYVIGSSKSSDFPVTGNAYQPVLWGAQDAFIAQIDPGAGKILYATFLGGEGVDDGRNILVGANGLVYFTASTLSSLFPMANFQYSLNPIGAEDVIIGVMDLTKSGGDSLVYSTYFGGTGNEEVRGMAFDAKGRLVITGYTLSTDLPVTGDAAQPTPGGNGDAFVALFDPSVLGRGGLQYCTYFGGAHTEVGYGVAADSAGSIYVTGYTLSSDLMVSGDVPQAEWGGGTDLFVAKFKPGTGGAAGVQFSTFLGSTNVYVPTGMALAPDGTIFVAGYGGIGLPSSSNARQGGYAGGATDGFLLVVSQQSTTTSSDEESAVGRTGHGLKLPGAAPVKELREPSGGRGTRSQR
jgi:hypothetical protein